MIINYILIMISLCKLSIFFIGVAVGSVLKDKIVNSFMSISYNCIYYYSKAQIMLRQLQEKLGPDDTNDGKWIYEFVKDGKPHYDAVTNYDFSIKCLLKNRVFLKKIMYPGDKEVDEHFLRTFEESDIRFLLVEFTVGEKDSIKIDLKTDDENYYLVGNKFNKLFFMYYVMKLREFNNIIIGENDKCSLKIIDHDVNELKIDFTVLKQFKKKLTKYIINVIPAHR